MINTILVAQNDLVAEFQSLPSWEAKYKKVIDLGKTLPAISDDLKTEESRVKGCQSQVWLHAKKDSSGNVIFTADSDGVLVRGLIAILLKIYSCRTPDEILNTPADFVSKIGFDSYLSPSRANGLQSMIKQIKYFALAFQYQN